MIETRPVRFILLGGFLGAGKTTALLRLARHYTDLGLRVGIITNDQAEGLVDTLAFREAGFTTEEIPSGCFCCHFEKLLEASGRLADGTEPDIILAEPVGSCTDLVNAVITPLKSLYTDRFVVAPYTVLLDPFRAQDALSATGPTGFSKKITYLYKMQQNEADIIAVNKADRLDDIQRNAVEALVALNFPKADVVFLSALTGEGFYELPPLLDGPGTVGQHPTEVDYAQYTEAEIALGWLNARVNLSGAASWDGNAYLEGLATSVRDYLAEQGVEIAHFKMRLIDEQGREAAVHLTNNVDAVAMTRRLDTPLQEGILVINLRAEGSPETLTHATDRALTKVGTLNDVSWVMKRCDAFVPSPPVPPPAERNTIRI